MTLVNRYVLLLGTTSESLANFAQVNPSVENAAPTHNLLFYASVSFVLLFLYDIWQQAPLAPPSTRIGKTAVSKIGGPPQQPTSADPVNKRPI